MNSVVDLLTWIIKCLVIVICCDVCDVFMLVEHDYVMMCSCDSVYVGVVFKECCWCWLLLDKVCVCGVCIVLGFIFCFIGYFNLNHQLFPFLFFFALFGFYYLFVLFSSVFILFFSDGSQMLNGRLDSIADVRF